MDKLEASEDLRGKILISIQREELHRARVYILTSLATALTSILGAVFAVKYMIISFYQSSFYSYFSLLFSDSDVALSYWREFLFSLAETLPLLGIILLLVAIGVFFMSLRVFANNIKIKQNFIPSFS
ncbi:MAG: hypothetical protein WAW13_04130 [Minisyncoccia bacterium]